MNFEQTLGRYVGRLHQALSKKLNISLNDANAGITTDQFRFLTHLWKEDGISQQTIATQLCRDRAGITRMIDILENQNLITRISDKTDKRTNLIYLTKRGKELQPIASTCAKRTLDEMTTNFSEVEKEQFSKLLQKAIENLKD